MFGGYPYEVVIGGIILFFIFVFTLLMLLLGGVAALAFLPFVKYSTDHLHNEIHKVYDFEKHNGVEDNDELT